MKKLLSLLLCLSILCTICACSKNETGKKENDDETVITEETVVTTTTVAATTETTPEETTETTVQMTVNERINSILDDAIKFWDEVLDPLKEFAEGDADLFGYEEDIKKFTENMEIYYNKLVEDKNFLDGLGDEYKDVKSMFDGLFELAYNVHNYLTTGKTEIEKPLPYMNDIKTYDKLLDRFMDLVIDNYYDVDDDSSDEDYEDYDDDDNE